MTGRDNRDTAGQFQNVPVRGHGDTGTPPYGGVPVSPVASPAERLHRLSRRLGRLSPNWREPEAFLEERDEIERELRSVAREVGFG